MSSQPGQLISKPRETDERQTLIRRAKLLAWLGVGWHGVEAAVAGFFRGRRAARPEAHRGQLLRNRLYVGFEAMRSLLTGERLGSSATKSEGQQNMLCAYLSAALLVGLGANALFGL